MWRPVFFFQKKHNDVSNCLIRAVVGNTLEPRRRFTEVAYSKEFAVRFLPSQLKMDEESALETLCCNYKSMVDKVKKKISELFWKYICSCERQLMYGLSKCFFDLSRMSIETDYTSDGGKTWAVVPLTAALRSCV